MSLLIAACALLSAARATPLALGDGLLAASDGTRIFVWGLGEEEPRYVLQSPTRVAALATRGQTVVAVGEEGMAVFEGPHLTAVSTKKEPLNCDIGLDPVWIGQEIGGLQVRWRVEPRGGTSVRRDPCLSLAAGREACLVAGRAENEVMLVEADGARRVVRGLGLITAGPAGLAVYQPAGVMLLSPDGAVLTELPMTSSIAVGPAGFAVEVAEGFQLLDARGQPVALVERSTGPASQPPPVAAPAQALGLQTTRLFYALDPATGATLWLTPPASLALGPQGGWAMHPSGPGEEVGPSLRMSKNREGVQASRGREVLWTHPAREFLHDGDEVVVLRPDMTHWIGVDKERGAERWTYTLDGRWTYATWQGHLLFLTEHLPDRGVRYRALDIDKGRIVAEGEGAPAVRLVDLPPGLMIISDRDQPMTVQTLRGKVLASVPQGKLAAVLEGDALLLTWEGGDSGLAVVDPKRGLRWRLDLPLKTDEVRGAGDLVVVFHGGELTAYDAAIGEERWRRPWSERLWGAHALR